MLPHQSDFCIHTSVLRPFQIDDSFKENTLYSLTDTESFIALCKATHFAVQQTFKCSKDFFFKDTLQNEMTDHNLI